MSCNAVFSISPADHSIEYSDLQKTISRIITRNHLSQLLWLEYGLSVEPSTLKQLGIYLDYRVIEQTAVLLNALADAYPNLSATISGRYSPFLLHETGSFNDDMGGFFRVTLQAGHVETEDTPIV